jgi:hypothetical protein
VNALRFLALEAWRKEPHLSPALTAAASWEAAAEELLRRRPRCLSAVYVEDEGEREMRRRAAARNAPLIPWLRASAEEALDLSARAKIEDWLDRAAALVDSCELATLAVLDAEGRQERAQRATERKAVPDGWSRAKRVRA